MFRSALGVRCFTRKSGHSRRNIGRRTFTFRMRLHWRFWRGTRALSITPSAATFGSVTVKTEATQTIKVSNTGTGELKIFSADIVGTGFSLSGLSAPAKLAAGSSTTFNVAFKPMAAGAEKGTVSIKTNASETPATVNLIGTGVEESVKLTASESSLSFGNVPVSNSQSKDVTITNSGNANVSIAGVSVSGAGFSVSGGSSMTLAPNQSETVTVNFNPKSKGSLAGTLTIASNAPTVKISLGGTALQGGNHSVGLTWTASTSPVIGYFVYRRTGTTGTFSRLDSSIDSLNELYGQQRCRRRDLRLRGHGGSSGERGECNFPLRFR